MRKSDRPLTTVILLVSILLAFAGNSILVRAALAGAQIDWAGYTIVRLVAGAVMLCVLFSLQKRKPIMPGRGDVAGALSLFVYAVTFSWAYVRLDAGVGALILFPAGQITMQIIGLFRGIVPSKRQVAGVMIALAGLIYLMAPGASAPPLVSSILMASAGVAWGFYTWSGKLGADPTLATARYFVGASVLALLLLPFVNLSSLTWYGAALAAISGGITSALGYVLWYKILARISITSAAVSQLSVPAIAAIGGVILLGEMLTARLLIGGMIIFIGIGLTIWASIRGSRN